MVSYWHCEGAYGATPVLRERVLVPGARKQAYPTGTCYAKLLGAFYATPGSDEGMLLRHRSTPKEGDVAMGGAGEDKGGAREEEREKREERGRKRERLEEERKEEEEKWRKEEEEERAGAAGRKVLVVEEGGTEHWCDAVVCAAPVG
eukprot:1864741-Rhodomonas_salina.3